MRNVLGISYNLGGSNGLASALAMRNKGFDPLIFHQIFLSLETYMRVVIYGGRDFYKKNVVNHALDQLHEEYGFTLVIDGKAKGADTLGHSWAKSRGILTVREPADWNKYGKVAGFIRNELMITKYKPEIGVGFPGGAGTKNMTGLLHKYGILVKTIVVKMT